MVSRMIFRFFRGFASLLSQDTQIFFALFENEWHLLSSPSSRASYNHKGLSQIINSHLAVPSTSSFSAFVCQQPVWLVWKVALRRDLGSILLCWCQVFSGHARKDQNCPYLSVCPHYKLAVINSELVFQGVFVWILACQNIPLLESPSS